MKWLTNNLSIEEVKKFLPHRFSFLLVDRVLEIDLPEDKGINGRKVHAVKCLTATDPVFQGHFPEKMIFPGVLILEAMAQAGGFAIVPSMIATPEQFSEMPKLSMLLVSAEDVKFRKPAFPGDRIHLYAEVLKSKKNIWLFQCHAKVNSELIAEAKIMALVDQTAGD